MASKNSGEKGELPVCSECQKPVKPEDARPDEDGKAIHPECLVLRLRLKREHPHRQG